MKLYIVLENTGYDTDSYIAAFTTKALATAYMIEEANKIVDYQTDKFGHARQPDFYVIEDELDNPPSTAFLTAALSK